MLGRGAGDLFNQELMVKEGRSRKSGKWKWPVTKQLEADSRRPSSTEETYIKASDGVELLTELIKDRSPQKTDGSDSQICLLHLLDT